MSGISLLVWGGRPGSQGRVTGVMSSESKRSTAAGLAAAMRSAGWCRVTRRPRSSFRVMALAWVCDRASVWVECSWARAVRDAVVAMRKAVGAQARGKPIMLAEPASLVAGPGVCFTL